MINDILERIENIKSLDEINDLLNDISELNSTTPFSNKELVSLIRAINKKEKELSVDEEEHDERSIKWYHL